MGGKTLIPAESPISCQIKGGAGQREEEVRLKKDAFFYLKYWYTPIPISVTAGLEVGEPALAWHIESLVNLLLENVGPKSAGQARRLDRRTVNLSRLPPP